MIRKKNTGLPWIAPAALLILVLIYYSIFETFRISALDWDGLDPSPKHVGMNNYKAILEDPIFWKSITHTIQYFVITFPIQTVLGFFIAALIHSNLKFVSIYKVLVFTPVIIAPATMAPVFRLIFGADGAFNRSLHFLHLDSLREPWLAQDTTAMPVLMFITMWTFTGITYILFYASMGQIDPQIIEAARIDGASNIKLLKTIVWPMCRKTTMIMAMLSVIGALKTFDIPNLVTGGGPFFSTEFLGTYIYRISIPAAHVGYGAALSVMLLIMSLIGSFAVAKKMSKRDNND